MSVESIVDKIHSDGHAEAESILFAAQKKADEIILSAKTEAEKYRQEVEADVEKRTRSIAEHYAATARLDVKKIRLAAKRRAVAEVYAMAKEKLLSLSEEDALNLLDRLLKTYAEEGDKVAFLGEFKYAKRAELLPVFAEKKLSVIPADRLQGVKADGGVYLVGKNADKNLSFDALLKADFEEHQTEIAESLFGKNQA